MDEVHFGSNGGPLKGQLLIDLSAFGQVDVQCWTLLSKMVMCSQPDKFNLL